MLLVGRELPAKASRASSPSKTHLEKSSPPLPRWLPPPHSTSTTTLSGRDTRSHHPPTLGKRRRHFGAHAPPPPPPPPQGPTGLNKKASSLTRPPSGSSTAASAQTTLLLSPSSSPSTSATQPTPSQIPACCRSSRPPKWKWFGLPPAHKRLDLGFLANAIQLFGALAFEVSVICGLPGVLGKSGAVGGVEQEGRVEREWIAAYWASESPPLFSLPLPRLFFLFLPRVKCAC